MYHTYLLHTGISQTEAMIFQHFTGLKLENMFIKMLRTVIPYNVQAC